MKTFFVFCNLFVCVLALPSTTFWVNTIAPVVTFAFDYCKIVSCPPNNWRYTVARGQFYLCVTRPGNENCYYWSDAGWNTGDDWNYKPKEGRERVDQRGRSLLVRITLTKGAMNPSGCTHPGNCLPLYLNVENPGRGDLGKYVMGVFVHGGWGGDFGIIELKDISQRPTVAPKVQSDKKVDRDQLVQEVVPIPGLSWTEVFSIETQTTPRKNLWVEWVKYNVRAQNISIGCIACAAANTRLYTHALTLPDENTTTCVMELLKGINSTGCPDYVPLIHKKPKVRVPGGVTILADNYTCYSSENTTGMSVGIFESGFCTTNSSGNAALLTNHTQYMYDIYWLCGDGQLRSRLPAIWKGQCTLVKLTMPFKILPWDPETQDESPRERRSIEQLHLQYEEDPQVYIDAIEVPRGVPDQYKAQIQVYAGFASLIPQVQINKNVDWLNYIYYSEQRFVNYSRDAFRGIVEELGPNTRMTLQNRLALDMLLAEKGGVCGMIGEECCTYIPQNSGVNGKTMVALRKITNLATELKSNAGVDTSFFSSWLGGLKGFLQQACLVVAGLVIVGLMLLCCVIPLYKKAMAKADPAGTFVSQEVDPLLLYDDAGKGDIEKYTALDKPDNTSYNTVQLRDLV